MSDADQRDEGFGRDPDLERARGAGRPASAELEGDGQAAGGASMDYAPDADAPSARDLQENPSQGQPLDAEPGSDADHAAEVPHVG